MLFKLILGILIEITVNEYLKIIDTAKLLKSKSFNPLLKQFNDVLGKLFNSRIC